MKLTIERGMLLRVLTHIQSVVEKRNTIPILSNVKFEAPDGNLSLNATDMDIEIIETIPADVSVAGSTTASAHTLFDIVRKLPEGSQVELDSTEEDEGLVLKSGRSIFTLNSLPIDDFPVLSSDKYSHEFSLPSSTLCNMIDGTKFAISTEETRYYLNGIYFHESNKDKDLTLRAVATDGHRLASIEVPRPAGLDGMPGVIIPRKTVTELRKLLDEFDEEVELSVSDTKIRFSFEGVVLTSKLIDGTFPDYDKVIPTKNDKILEVDTKSFAEAVSRVSAISSERSRAIKLELTLDNLVLSANSSENGSAIEELLVSFKSDNVEIGFNSRYLQDITQQINGSTARFTLADAASPTLIQDVDNDSAIYVLMPMRV